MNRTRVGTLVTLAVVGGVAMFLIEVALVASGLQRFTPALSLPIVLVVLAAVVLIAAVRVWRSTRRRSTRRVDPFHATRVVLLAQASALTGALLGGAFVGAIAFLWTRFLPGLGSLLDALAALGGSVVLLVAGLVAERLCVVPPDEDDDDKPGPGAATPA